MKLTPFDLLSLYLLTHKHDSSNAYYKSLPSSIDCPLSWDFKDIQALPIQSKFFALQARNHMEKISRKIPFKRSDFMWAQSAVITRNFQGPRENYISPGWLIKNDKNQNSMLVPLLDLANHSVTPNSIYSFDYDENQLILRSAEKIMPGEQIFISYGRTKGDHELLSTYGFCMKPLENPNTSVLISPVELLKINGKCCTKSWLVPGADNLIKYSLTTDLGPSQDLLHAIKEIAKSNNETFLNTWTAVLLYRLERISNCAENFRLKIKPLTEVEITLLQYYLTNPPVEKPNLDSN